MPQEHAALQLVREALEGVLTPKIAAAVLLEALEGRGDPPSTREELLAFVRGPLTEILTRRVGHGEASAVAERLEPVLSIPPPNMSSLPPSPGSRSSNPPGRRDRDRDITTSMPMAKDPVAVLVVASGSGMATRLGAALGPMRVAAYVRNDVERVRAARAPFPPQILLVDATDFPAIEPETLANVVGEMPVTTVCAIWGAEAPYGRSFFAEMQTRGLTVMALEKREGVEPLLDLIRSRQLS